MDVHKKQAGNGWVVGLIGFILLMIVICNLPSDSNEIDAPSYSRIQRSNTSKSVQSKTTKAPIYTVFNTFDTSFPLAGRITLYIKLDGDYNKKQIYLIIEELTQLYIQKGYDLIWLEISPQNARPSEGMRGLSPVLCKTKWIAPDLDSDLRVSGDGFRAEETRGGIGINWHDDYFLTPLNSSHPFVGGHFKFSDELRVFLDTTMTQESSWLLPAGMIFQIAAEINVGNDIKDLAYIIRIYDGSIHGWKANDGSEALSPGLIEIIFKNQGGATCFIDSKLVESKKLIRLR